MLTQSRSRHPRMGSEEAANPGLLGHVTGRTSACVLACLEAQTPQFPATVQFVAIDPAAVYAKATRTRTTDGTLLLLPNATLVVDHFDLIKLANDAVTAAHRRLIWQHCRRDGPRRQTVPMSQPRRLLDRHWKREDGMWPDLRAWRQQSARAASGSSWRGEGLQPLIDRPTATSREPVLMTGRARACPESAFHSKADATRSGRGEPD